MITQIVATYNQYHILTFSLNAQGRWYERRHFFAAHPTVAYFLLQRKHFRRAALLHSFSISVNIELLGARIISKIKTTRDIIIK